MRSVWKKTSVVLLLLSILSVLSCSTAFKRNVGSIEVGTTYSEVFERLGRFKAKYGQKDGSKILIYRSGFVDCAISFQEEKVAKKPVCQYDIQAEEEHLANSILGTPHDRNLNDSFRKNQAQ